jgi:hypothetical protein
MAKAHFFTDLRARGGKILIRARHAISYERKLWNGDCPRNHVMKVYSTGKLNDRRTRRGLLRAVITPIK